MIEDNALVTQLNFKGFIEKSYNKLVVKYIHNTNILHRVRPSKPLYYAQIWGSLFSL